MTNKSMNKSRSYKIPESLRDNWLIPILSFILVEGPMESFINNLMADTDYKSVVDVVCFILVLLILNYVNKKLSKKRN